MIIAWVPKPRCLNVFSGQILIANSAMAITSSECRSLHHLPSTLTAPPISIFPLSFPLYASTALKIAGAGAYHLFLVSKNASPSPTTTATTRLSPTARRYLGIYHFIIQLYPDGVIKEINPKIETFLFNQRIFP